MAYEKLLNEIYAITALKYFWLGYRKGFIKWESPDWFHREADIGIEVSQALLPKDGQEENFIETYLGKHRKDIPEDAARRYGDRLYFYNDRLWALLDDGTSAISCEEKILTRFKSKLLKLNTNYHHCKTNALYLFAHEELTEGEVREINEKLIATQKPAEYRFDLLFLDCKSTLYIADLNQNKMEAILIPQKAQRFLDEKTEALRQSFANEPNTLYE